VDSNILGLEEIFDNRDHKCPSLTKTNSFHQRHLALVKRFVLFLGHKDITKNVSSLLDFAADTSHYM